MRLILTRDDIRKDMLIVYSIPNLNISDEIQENLRVLHQEFRNEKEKEKISHKERGSYSAYYFRIPSAYFKDVELSMMLTLYFEEHENTHFFTPIIEETIQKLQNIPELSKALYISTPHSQPESFKIFGKMINNLTECFFEVAKIHETYNLGLAEVLILGNKGGGKTTIVDYLINGKFVEQESPTLSPRVLQAVFNNVDFRVIDVCCTEHVKEILDDHPIEEGKLPQAIVYVVDATLKDKKLNQAIEEFNGWIQYLSVKYPENTFSKIPLLILFNKVDMEPNFNEEKYEKMFDSKKFGINARYDSISVKFGINVEENFRWLVDNLKVTEKY